MNLNRTILIEYADMKEEIKDLRRRIRDTEREIERLHNIIVTDSVACGKKGKKPLRTVKVQGIPNMSIERKKNYLERQKRMLTEAECRLLEQQTLAEEYIESIEKSELRIMFRFYYIDSLTWVQTAHQMNALFPKRRIKYTEDNCRMRHNRFFEEIS